MTDVTQKGGRGRFVALGLVLGACATACGGSAASAAPDFPQPPPSTPLTWSTLVPTDPILGGPVFGGPGNQFLEVAVSFRDGFVGAGETVDDPARSGVIWTSTDGTSWQRVADEDRLFANSNIELLATNGSRILAVGDAPTSGPAPIWVSDDGSAWRTSATASAALSGIAIGGVAAAEQGFLAWGIEPSGTFTTFNAPDGEQWTQSSFARDAPMSTINAVAAYRGGWVAVGARRDEPSQSKGIGGPTPPAEAWFSVDGTSWTPTPVNGHALGRVYAGASGLVALGSGPLGCGGCVEAPNVWHSIDGRTWTLVGQDATVNAVYESDGVRIVRSTTAETISLEWSTDGMAWRPLARDLPMHSEYGPFVVGPHGILFLENPPVDQGTSADSGVWYLQAQ